MTAEERPSDLLYGVPAIANYLGLREKQARHRIDEKLIPSFKVGATICARKSTLDAWLKDQEAKAAVEGHAKPEGDPNGDD